MLESEQTKRIPEVPGTGVAFKIFSFSSYLDAPAPDIMSRLRPAPQHCRYRLLTTTKSDTGRNDGIWTVGTCSCRAAVGRVQWAILHTSDDLLLAHITVPHQQHLQGTQLVISHSFQLFVDAVWDLQFEFTSRIMKGVITFTCKILVLWG